MQAVRFHTYGGPEVLRYEELETPTLHPDELLVRVCYAGVSPLDVLVRKGMFKEFDYFSLPCILGWELSGEVVEVGSSVTSFKVGEALFAHPSAHRSGGAYAEYVTIKEKEAAHKPSRLSHKEAAAISMNALTAWQALFDIGQLSQGQTLLIHGAAGGVGHLAVQLAKWKGVHVIGTASASNHKFLFDLGTDEVVDYATSPFEQVVKNVDVVLDTRGGETLTKSFAIVKKGGVIVSLVDFEAVKEASKFGIRKKGVIVSPNAKQLSEIAQLTDQGKLKVHIAASFPLKDACKAHTLLEMGHVRGKIVLEVGSAG